jgi:hypothetical protein
MHLKCSHQVPLMVVMLLQAIPAAPLEADLHLQLLGRTRVIF